MNSENFKLAVAGIGGIGGLLAGPLARTYGDAVSLIARGRRAEHLRSEGLTLHTDIYGDFTVNPVHVATVDELPVQDVILVCVKNDSLQLIADQIKPLVGDNTLVVPVMNGVSAGDNLRRYLGKGLIAPSVIYTVSSAGEDYSITQKGGFTTIYVGALPGDTACQAAVEKMAELFKAAGIDCRVSQDVLAAIWSKYVLNCAYNVMTARWGINIGTIKNNESLRADYRTLMEEAYRVGLASGVNLPENLLDKHMDRLDHTTDDSTSSLSRDFDIGVVGEMEVFSGEVVRMGEKTGVPTPLTNQYYEGLKERASVFPSRAK